MRILNCCFGLLLCAATVRAEPPYWNQFRGPHGDGSTPQTGLPLRWSEQQNVTWKTPIPGRGWSSPVVWKDQIWLTTATPDGKQLFAVCVDLKSGEVLHHILVFEVSRPRYRHPTNSYASPTPFVEEGRVYVHFGAYGTACLDTETGEKLWERRDFVCDDFRGPGSSPIISGDLLHVNFDGIDLQYVVALDKHTGRTAWKRDRNIDYGTDNPDRMKAYGTPLVIEHGGRRQLISPSAAETIAYDPETGEELWRVRHGGMNAAARPLYKHGLVYIAAGDGQRRLIAVRPEGTGYLDDQIVWNCSRSVPLRPSQALQGKRLLMIDDNGVASCLDALSGEVQWRERVGGEHWASPLAAEGRLYCFSKEGPVTVLAAEGPFRVLAENQLDAGFVASPAVADGALLLRTKTHLYRIEE